MHGSISLLCNALSANLQLHPACVESIAAVKITLMLEGVVQPHRQRQAVEPMLVDVMQVI